VLTSLVNNGVYPEPLCGENNRPEKNPDMEGWGERFVGGWGRHRTKCWGAGGSLAGNGVADDIGCEV